MDNRDIAEKLSALAGLSIRIRGRVVSAKEDGIVLAGQGVEYEIPAEHIVGPLDWRKSKVGTPVDVDVSADATVIQRRLVEKELLAAMSAEGDLVGAGLSLRGGIDCCRCTDCRCVCDCHDCSRCVGDCHDCSRCAGGLTLNAGGARFRRPIF